MNKSIKDLFKYNKNIVLLTLSHFLNKNKNYFIFNDNIKIDISMYNKILSILKREKNGEPIQYLLGKWNFYGLDLIVDKRALIPRFETELLVEEILKLDISNKKILDLCTGSGAISIALGSNEKTAYIVGSDISKNAINLSNENKKLHNLENVEFVVSDLFEKIEGKFDIICSNPPYINYSDMKTLDRRLYYEPQNALYGGYDGMFFYRKIIKNIRKYLNNYGIILFEIGYNEKDQIYNLLSSNNFKNISFVKDYNNVDRIVKAFFREEYV